MKNSLVLDFSVSRQYSVKILVKQASSLRFRIFSTDVTQVYLQSIKKLKRDIYIGPTSELFLKSDKVFNLLKPLYGLEESGGYWGSTFRNHVGKKLKMQPIIGNHSFFFPEK